MPYIVLIILSVFMAYLSIFGYIPDFKYFLPVKIMQVTISQIYLYKLQAADIEFLIFI